MLGAKSSIQAFTDSLAIDHRLPGDRAERFIVLTFLDSHTSANVATLCM